MRSRIYSSYKRCCSSYTVQMLCVSSIAALVLSQLVPLFNTFVNLLPIEAGCHTPE